MKVWVRAAARLSSAVTNPEDSWKDAGVGPARSRTGRALFFALGMFFVILAAAGVVLPVLPTTPFLLLAAAFFARSSPRFYGYLINSRLFGPLIREWRETRTVPLKAKITAVSMIALAGGSSVIFFVRPLWMQLVVASVLIGISIWLFSLPTRKS